MFELATLLLVSIFIIFLSVDGVVITVPPVSVVAPIYTTATFTCEGTGIGNDQYHWLIERVALTDSTAQQRQITAVTTTVNNTNFSSVLTINALPINDGLEISSLVTSLNPYQIIYFHSVLLNIRGISSVEDIQYNFTINNSLFITWSPPSYSSADIPDGSPVSYQVLVTDDEDEILLDTNTPNTSVTVPNITDCDSFNISVTALLDQYTSIGFAIKNGSFGYVVNITINNDDFIRPNVTIKLSCPPSQSNTSLTITSDSTAVIDQYTFTGTDESINDIRTLIPHHQYNYTVRVFNLRNKLQYETYAIITTYQVIGLYINNTYTNGSVSVQCIYQLVSTDDGCHVIFTDTSNGRNEHFNITGSDYRILSVSTSGVYNVSVYYLNNGSIYGPPVQYHSLVEIVIINIPSLSNALTTINVIRSEFEATFYYSSPSVFIEYTPMITTGPMSATMIELSEKASYYASPTVSIEHTPVMTATPDSTPIIQLLYTLSSVVAGSVIFLILVIVSIFWIRRRKKNEVTKDPITTNIPAYTEGLYIIHDVQTDVNPAYDRPTVQTDVNPAYDRPTVQTDVNPAYDRPIVQTDVNPAYDRPTVQTDVNPAYDRPTVQTDVNPAYDRPTVQTDVNPAYDRPIVQTDVNPAYDRPIVQTDVNPAYDRPTVQTDVNPAYDRPIVQT
uniref:Fibronectin type-III domain-containing protein n=1 Tax=Amphimedon queenslandica TaxID=400682 RepID=A0A1X7UJR4_AMPQE